MDYKETVNIGNDETLKNLELRLKEAQKLFNEKKYEEAKPILLDYIKEAESINKEDENQRFFSFRNVREFFCAIGKNKGTKKMVWSTFNYSWAYNTLSYIANEEGNHNLAIEYCDKAIYYNPMDSNLYFEKAESYKFMHDFENMAKVVRETYDILFYHEELSRYYRFLGYYYTEIKKYDVSLALYLVSLHFCKSDIAYNEIAYIRQQLNNPNFKVTTEEALKLLEQENIHFGIKEENKTILSNIINEKDISEKRPQEIDFIKKELEILNMPMTPVDELYKVNTPPKITADDIFDDNKIILTETDKQRQSKNIEYIKSKNILYKEDMKTVPIESATKLRTKDEVIQRMLADYVVATFCGYALNNNLSNIEDIINKMDQKLSIRSVLNQDDWNVINAIISKKVPQQQLVDFSWFYEECAVLAWALGLIDKPESDKECDLNKIDDIFYNCNSIDELKTKCALRSKEEILEFDDLISRYHWACREARFKSLPLQQLKEMIVQQQHTGLDWLLCFDLKNIMKDHINVNYEKDNFAFRFTTPTSWVIDKVNSVLDPYLMFALRNHASTILFDDLGKCDLEKFNEKYNNDINTTKTAGYNIIGQYSISSNTIKSGIKQVVLEKTNVDHLFRIVRYYFVLNGNMVCVETVLKDDTNINDINSVQNDINNATAFNIVFSIKELDKVNEPNINDVASNMAKTMNYKLHAEQLSIPLLNGFIKEESKDPMVILIAMDNNKMFLEQLITDGPMNPNETIDQRINFVNKSLLDYMKDLSQDNTEKSIFYYKDYANNVFNYKVYVHDMIVDTNAVKKVIRSLNAFFIEPRFNDFYQLSISTPPFEIPTEKLKLGVVDLENDEITKILDGMLNSLMDNLTYKNFIKDDKKYTDNINMNGINVPYNKSNTEGLVYADPNQLFKADIEGSTIQNLNIKDCTINDEVCVKNLYKIILTCGEYETPYVDEFTLEEYLKDEQKVITLVKKFPEVNKIHFNNELTYLTFSLDDETQLRKYIEILRRSFKNNRQN